MPEVRYCPRCGAPLRAEAGESSCPACAMRGAFETNEGSDAEVGMQSPQSQVPHPKIRYFGDYELLEEIARGGMGVIYRARQVSLKRTVAIKMILAGQMAGPTEVQRFRAEAEAAARLQHANIVAIHEVGVHEGQHYFSMDYVEGQNLAELVGSNPLPPRRAAGYVKIIAEAIGFAHQQGILHRDVKPSNVLIDLFDQPRITDFGLAKQTKADSDLTISGQVIGSPSFMPPEQAIGKRGQIGVQSDVYSLGAILYYLLTARPPFAAETLVETLHQVCNTEPISPRLLNPSVPCDLETICLKCLAKEPRRRYATAHELAEELARFIRDEPVLARPAGRVGKTWRWCRRRPVIAGLATSTALLLLAVAIGSPIAAFRVNRERLQADNQRDRAKALAESNRQNLYAARINLAHHTFQEGDVAHAVELLNSLRPGRMETDLRGFEWYYLWRLCHSERFTLTGHNGPVRSVAFSPDDLILATGGDDGKIRLWNPTTGKRITDPATGKQRPSLKGHTGWITSLAFAPDGKTLASGSTDKTVKLWDASRGELLFTLDGHTNSVSCVLFAPGGRLLATATSQSDEGVEYGPVSRLVPGIDWGEAKLWDLATRKARATLPSPVRGILSLAFSPDGRMLATGNYGPVIKVWSTETGKGIATHTNSIGNAIPSMLFIPSDNTLAIASLMPHRKRAELTRWDVETKKEQPLLKGDVPLVLSMALAPDGQTLATGSLDHTLQHWDLATGQERRRWKGHTDCIFSLAFSSDGRTLATGSRDGTVKLWDVDKPQDCDILVGAGSYSKSFSPDGRLLASSGPGVQLWDPAVGKLILALTNVVGDDVIVRFSPDGKLLAATGTDGVVHVWDVETWRQRYALKAHPKKIWCLAFAPDSKLLATGSEDNLVKLWDMATGSERASLTGHTSNPGHMAFAPGGNTLISGNDAEMIFWNVSTRELTKVLKGRYGLLTLSPDGKILASGNVEQGIKLKNLATMKELVTLKGHTTMIWGLAFSADGKTVATSGWDGSVKLWHVATGQELLTFKSSFGVNWEIAFSPDGRTLAFGSGEARTPTATLLRAATESEAALQQQRSN